MCEKIFIGVVISVIGGVILALVLWFGGGGKARWERYKVYKWLKANTKNKPGETHKYIMEIAIGTGFTEDRVRNACIAKKLFCYSNGGKEQWSVWCENPQSLFTGKSVEELLKEM